MTSLSEQLSAVRKSQWEAQLDVFRTLSKRALDSAEQLIALNMKTSRASVEQATGTFKQLLEITNPQDLLTIGSSAQGQWQQFFTYGRELLGIATGTHERAWTVDAVSALASPLQLVPATANVPTSVSQMMEQAAIATADAATVDSEIVRAAVDTGSALAEAALDAGQQAAQRTEEAAAATFAMAPAEPVTTVTVAAGAPAAGAPAAGTPAAGTPAAPAEPLAAAEPPAPALDPVDTAIADDVPPAKAKPLAKALNKVAPKPPAAEHPIASTVPLEAGPQVDLPIVTPTEGAQPLRVVTQGGKSNRNPRKK